MVNEKQVEAVGPRMIVVLELKPAPIGSICQHPWTFSVWTQFTVQTGKRSELPRGMPLVTRVFASSEHAWDPMASSSVNFCRKTRTAPDPGQCSSSPFIRHTRISITVEPSVVCASGRCQSLWLAMQRRARISITVEPSVVWHGQQIVSTGKKVDARVAHL